MRRFDLKVLRKCAATTIVLLAALAWPSAGWSKGHLQACEVHDVQRLLDNWAKKLSESTPANPDPVVGTYEQNGSVLLPTCANGPALGHADIRKYFVDHFLANKPVVTDHATPFVVGTGIRGDLQIALLGAKTIAAATCQCSTYVCAAAISAAKPRSRSAVRSSTASSPIWKRTVGPPGCQRVAVRTGAQSKGMARLS